MNKLILIVVLAMMPTYGFAEEDYSVEKLSFSLYQDVKVEITDEMSTYEVWNSVSPIMIDNGDVLVTLYELDVEAAPVISRNRLLAIILVGEYGTGIVPVAFRLIAPDSLPVKIKPHKDKISPAKFDIIVGADLTYSLVVKSNGSVTLDNHYLGTIQ